LGERIYETKKKRTSPLNEHLANERAKVAKTAASSSARAASLASALSSGRLASTVKTTPSPYSSALPNFKRYEQSIDKPTEPNTVQSQMKKMESSSTEVINIDDSSDHFKNEDEKKPKAKMEAEEKGETKLVYI
jgi:hypothetical protein